MFFDFCCFSRLISACRGLVSSSVFPLCLDIFYTSALRRLHLVIAPSVHSFLLHLEAQQRINSGAYRCRWLKSNTQRLWPERPRCCPLYKVPDLLRAVREAGLQQVPVVQLESSTLFSSDSNQLSLKDNSQQQSTGGNQDVVTGVTSVVLCGFPWGADNLCFQSRLRMDVSYLAHVEADSIHTTLVLRERCRDNHGSAGRPRCGHHIFGKSCSVHFHFASLDSPFCFGRRESSPESWWEPKKWCACTQTQVRFTCSVNANGLAISFEPRPVDDLGFLLAATSRWCSLGPTQPYLCSIFKSAGWKWIKPNEGWKFFGFSHTVEPDLVVW